MLNFLLYYSYFQILSALPFMTASYDLYQLTAQQQYFQTQEGTLNHSYILLDI